MKRYALEVDYDTDRARLVENDFGEVVRYSEALRMLELLEDQQFELVKLRKAVEENQAWFAERLSEFQ
mgnify:CR=1 FL=1